MKKIIVLGSAGAGKSTLTRQLGELYRIPIYHLDKIYWNPDWIPTPGEEFDNLVNEIVKKEKWIIDGNYSRTLEIRFKEADTIIFLDMPRYLSMFRIIKRRFMYHGKTRPDMSEGCKEQLDWEFIKWAWSYNKNKKQNILKKIRNYSKNKKFIILKSPNAVRRFLDSLT